MSTDPGLTSDTCIFIEAISGDGGTHSTGSSPAWWLSPDIQLTGPVSGADAGDANRDNPVVVKAHRKNACTLASGVHNVFAELWIGNPALAMAPNINTRQISSTALIAVAGLPAGGTATHTFTWHPPAGATDPDPEAPGHKCLIARVYSENVFPDANDFHVPEDQHVAQHNITVVAAPVGGHMRMNISTGNPNKFSQRITVNVQQDTKPSRFVLNAVEPSVKRVREFQSFAATVTPIALETTNFHAHIATELAQIGPIVTGVATKKAATKATTKAATKTVAATRRVAAQELIQPVKGVEISSFLTLNPTTRRFGQLTRPNLQAIIALQPRVFQTFAFTADLSKAKRGEGRIYHLTQAGADGKLHGGLTVVVVGR